MIAATGEFLAFVDCDDIIKKNFGLEEASSN
jgi:hypothetical protein